MDGWLDCHTEKVKTVNKFGQLVIPDILHRDLILSFMHIIFNLRDIKVVICILLNIEVGIVGVKLFCERICVTCTLQVHAHVVEINPQ